MKLQTKDGETIKQAVERLVREGADLRGADLWGVNLEGADLREADLRETNLRGANLRGANLRGVNLEGVNLRRANLWGANLGGVNLRGAKLSWSDHMLISEILLRAAGDDIEKLKLAGLVRLKTDWCWMQFMSLDDRNKDWALAELRKWIQPGDGHPKEIEE